MAGAEGFEGGVFEEGGAGFFDRREVRKVIGIHHTEGIANDLANFRSFVSIASRDDERRSGHGKTLSSRSKNGERFLNKNL